MAGETEEYDPAEEYMKRYDLKVESAEKLRNMLYDHVIDTIDNRISTQFSGVSNEHLHQYASNLFLSTDLGTEKHPSQIIQSEKCVLEVRVHRAESLAPKDVAGTSDPYCVLGLASQDLFTNLRSKKHVTKYVTTVKPKTLNPEWNECLEIPVTREQINDHFFHIQIWDHDEAESMASALGSLKEVKGIRGMGRYMKEVAQTVGKKDNADDFMGFSAVPLKNIPLDGLEKWYSLRAHGALQNISGRVRIGLKVTCPHILIAESDHPGKMKPIVNGRRMKNQLSNEAIYGGIVALVVNGRHNIYKDLMSEDENGAVDGWDGKLQNVDETLLKEFETQRRIDKLTRAIVRWEIYCEEHVQLQDGIKMACMTNLLKALEDGNQEKSYCVFQPLQPIAGKGEKATIFTFDVLPQSFDKFLRHCHTKIEKHQELYPVKQNDTILRLGDLLICMKTLRESKLYLTAKCVDTTMFGSGDISKDISQSLRLSMTKFYEKLCVEQQVISANVATVDDGDPIEEYNVPGIVKLVDTIHTALLNGHGYYHPVFKKVLKIDYMAVVLGAISSKLSGDLKDILYKVNKVLSAEPDPVEEESANKSTAMFQLYLSLRDFSLFMNDLLGGGEVNAKFGALSMQQLTNGEPEVHEHIGALQGFHEWFRPTILRWLQMSRGRTIQRLTAAVRLDKVDRIDDIAKHSSSSVDAIGCLSSVVTFWHKIKWPDLMDGFVIATRITEDISNGAELYADLVHDKLKAVGFFDDEGQFDVTEELCLALNNLEKVKGYLVDVLSDMHIENLAAKIDRVEEGPSGEHMLDSFKALVRNADDAMRRKIREVTAVVGKKMQPDIHRYVKDFVTHVLKVSPKKTAGNPLNGHDSDYDLNRKEWEKIGEEAIGPMMNYLTTNVITLKEWLCDSNFQILLAILWRACIQSIREVVLGQYKIQKPQLFKLTKYILKDHLTVFFHADGEGLELEDMLAVQDYAAVEMELKMRGASSKDLMRLFLSQMYDGQEALESTRHGTLNICSWYDVSSSEIKVDVISAENLVARDMNGFSDPFVQINLMPKVMFPTLTQKQTLEKKKTLNPLFDGESFSFKVEKEVASEEGAMIVFTVLDYDVIGKNELEGECVIPMNILDGLNTETTQKRANRTFKLPLTVPKAEKNGVGANEVATDGSSNQGASSFTATPLELLQQRTSFDRDASEFCRWRKRLEDSMEDDDNAKTPNNFIKSLLS